jgi:hypothetical protein
VDPALTNGEELVFQPTVLRPAASATGFLPHYLEFQLFKMGCRLFMNHSGKMLFQNACLKGNQKKIRSMNIRIQSNDGIFSSYERGDELPYHSWDNFRVK